MVGTENLTLTATKKQNLKKKRRIRMKRRLIVFLFLFACVSLIFTVLKAPFFNVKTIICVGQEELTEAQITEIAGAKLGSNIFLSGVKNMKRRLAGNPLIEQSNVRRLFPNKIKIWVREAQEVMYAEKAGLILLADKNGQIIKVAEKGNTEVTLGVAKLEGFEAAKTTLGDYIIDTENPVHDVVINCVGILDKLEILGDITKICATDLSDIRIDYQDRLEIMIGSYEQMEYKLTFVKKVISENITEYEKAVLDYRGSTLYVGSKISEEEEPAENDENSQTGEENIKEDETKIQDNDGTLKKEENAE